MTSLVRNAVRVVARSVRQLDAWARRDLNPQNVAHPTVSPDLQRRLAASERKEEIWARLWRQSEANAAELAALRMDYARDDEERLGVGN